MDTLEEFYNDIYSRLGLSGDDHSIYRKDIINAINDSIRSARVNYARNEIAYEIATTENITSLSEDSQYPFVNSASLSGEVMSELPIEYTVLSSTAYTTSNEIQNSTQSFNEGDIARKGNKLYECTFSFSGVNTFNDTFNPRNYRTYYRNNQINYNSGDVVYDKESGEWFEVNTDFQATTDDTADNVSELDRLYWKEIGDANVYIAHYPFKNIQVLKIFDELRDTQGLTIKDDTVYTTKDITQLTLTYVPKWTDVTSFSDTIDIPDFMVNVVKNQSLRLLSQKLNIEIQLEEQELPTTQQEQEDE